MSINDVSLVWEILISRLDQLIVRLGHPDTFVTLVVEPGNLVFIHTNNEETTLITEIFISQKDGFGMK